MLTPIRISSQSPPLVWCSIDYSSRAFSDVQKKSILTNLVTIFSGLLFTFLILGLIFRELNILYGKEVAAFPGLGNSNFLEELEEIKYITINSIFLLSFLASAILFLKLHSTNRTFIEKVKVERLIENSQGAGVILDRNGRITYSNKRFQSFFGYREDEILRYDFHDLLHGHALAKEECQIFNAIFQSKEVTAVEKVYSSTAEEFNGEITVLTFFGQGKNLGSIGLIKKL